MRCREKCNNCSRDIVDLVDGMPRGLRRVAMPPYVVQKRAWYAKAMAHNANMVCYAARSVILGNAAVHADAYVVAAR